MVFSPLLSVILFFFLFISGELPWKNNSESYFFDTVLKRTDSISDFGSMNVWIFVFLSTMKGVELSGKVFGIT